MPASPPPPASISKHPKSTVQEPFSDGEEFVPFAFFDPDKDTTAVPIREWDQGKENIDAEKRGKKRKSEVMSRDGREYDRDGRKERGHRRDRDRDGEKRQRMENVYRYAPWIATADLEKCVNVPEL